MNAVDFVIRVIDALDRLHIDYVTVGSFAVNAYADPRSTKDADFVLQIDHLPIAQLAAEIGPDFEFDPQMSFESVTLTPRFKIRHRESIFTVEFFGLTDDPHDQERFARRVHGAVGGRRAFVLSAEDVIVTKLRWAVRAKRAKDLEDVRTVLGAQSGKLDYGYIRHWCAQHGTLELFEQLYTEAKQFES
jgi:hypothetical protein